MKRIFIFFTLIIISLSFVSCTNGMEYNSLLDQLGYNQEDIVVLINAEDYGMHVDTTESIIDLIQSGSILNTSIMVPGQNFEEASNRAAESNISVGVHMTLTNEWQGFLPWHPVQTMDNAITLFNENRYMWENVDMLSQHAWPFEVKNEMETQLIMALEEGLDLTHIDSHNYSYIYNQEFNQSAIELGLKYRLPVIVTNKSKAELYENENVKKFFDEDLKLIVPDTYTSLYLIKDEDFESDTRANKYDEYFMNLTPGVHVLSITPGLKTDGVETNAPDILLRSKEYEYFTSDEFRQVAEKKGIKFINYKELRDLQRTFWTDDFVNGILE